MNTEELSQDLDEPSLPFDLWEQGPDWVINLFLKRKRLVVQLTFTSSTNKNGIIIFRNSEEWLKCKSYLCITWPWGSHPNKVPKQNFQKFPVHFQKLHVSPLQKIIWFHHSRCILKHWIGYWWSISRTTIQGRGGRQKLPAPQITENLQKDKYHQLNCSKLVDYIDLEGNILVIYLV